MLTLDQAGDINRIGKELPKLLKGAENIYTDLPRSFAPKTAFSWYLSGLPLHPDDGISKALAGTSVRPLRPLLNQLRVRKTGAEISLMRKVGQASGRAITRAMRRSWTSEKKLVANLEYSFLEQGMDGVGYVPVVASGTVRLILRYNKITADA
jgi:intermediate cleaving peptidase 55